MVVSVVAACPGGGLHHPVTRRLLLIVELLHLAVGDQRIGGERTLRGALPQEVGLR